jgi:hypothetical protein
MEEFGRVSCYCKGEFDEGWHASHAIAGFRHQLVREVIYIIGRRRPCVRSVFFVPYRQPLLAARPCPREIGEEKDCRPPRSLDCGTGVSPRKGMLTAESHL